MRLFVLAVAVLLVAGPVAAQPAPPRTLDALAAWVQIGNRPVDAARAPATLSIDRELQSQLIGTVLDGGMEATLHLALRDGRLSLARTVAGRRYRTSTACEDCFFVQPFTGHTHPYENPFSVQDLMLAASGGRPSLMVTTAGQIWLAVPTKRAVRNADGWWPLRYALFGNRLECPARSPADGWAAPTPMGRRVEAVARAAAHDLGLALYVADPGEDFRKVEGIDHRLPVLDFTRPVAVDQFNTYEMTLLRLMHHQGENSDGLLPTFTPDQDMGKFDQAVAGLATTERNPAIVGGIRLLGNMSSEASDHWLHALPTTVYTHPYADLEAATLPFMAVQMSDDCDWIMVLKGEQTFAPNSVAYTAGWRRRADATGPVNAGWAEMDRADFPRGHVVPW